MDAIEFITKYEIYLNEISSMIKSELLAVIQQLKELDPHDLVSTGTCFQSENEVRGYVWNLFVKRAKKYSKI